MYAYICTCVCTTQECLHGSTRGVHWSGANLNHVKKVRKVCGCARVCGFRVFLLHVNRLHAGGLVTDEVQYKPACMRVVLSVVSVITCARARARALPDM